jgi:Brp/Blh family beta-carotene 15,15'-monooxygenase
MFRTSKLFLLSALSFSVLFIGIGLISPAFNESISIWVLLASVFIVGIPHGAIDHIIASELFNNTRGVRGHLLFYSSYLFVMAILGLIWFLSPAAGMIIFLIISIYHFGQADMEDFISDEQPSYLWNVMRGAFIIGLILFSNTGKTFPVIADATGLPEAAFYNMFPQPTLIIIVLVCIYVAAFVYSVYQKKIQNPSIFFADAVLLTSLFLIAGPFIGFGVYFAVWHSTGHIHEMIHFFNNRNKSFGLTDFIFKSLPFTFISLLGLAGLYYIQTLIGSGQTFVTLMFILISVLTLPHMVVVNKMYNSYKSS